MDISLIIFYLIMLVLTSVLAYTMGVYVLYSRERNRNNVIFASMCILIAIWAICSVFSFYVAMMWRDLNLSFFFHKLSYFGNIFIPIAIFLFVLSYGGEEVFFQNKYSVFLIFIPSIITYS
ncbi:MAG: histidine kinase N-terminal 7TM domain-containing protein, partial [Candidatus Hodarchaeales archaeon]